MDLRLRPKVNPRTDPSLLLDIPSSKRVIVNDLDPELGEGLRHDFPKLRTKGSKQYKSTLQLEFYFNIGISVKVYLGRIPIAMELFPGHFIPRTRDDYDSMRINPQSKEGLDAAVSLQTCSVDNQLSLKG
jgi:hypothetical protein